MTSESLHPAATQHLPMFITAPGDTDVLMVAVAIFLLGSVLGFGLLFLRLHTLPERIAHKSHKLQFEIVAVLGLIALFTHMHIFWVIGLVLALVDFPDIGGWMSRIAGSVEKIAGNEPDRPIDERNSGAPGIKKDEPATGPPNEKIATSDQPRIKPKKHEELGHV